MKQVTLSKKEKKSLNKKINEQWGIDQFFSTSDFVVLAEDIYVLKDGEVIFFYKDALLLPSLKLVLTNNFLKKVTVDMGAVPFMAKGSDLMKPGIVKVDDSIEEGDVVVIIDEKNTKPIAIGKSLFSATEINEMKTGKVVLNLHHVGDEVWGFSTGAD